MVSVALILSTLCASLGLYFAAQQEFKLEGNHLYSTNAIEVQGTADGILNSADQNGDSVHLFKALSEDEKVRAFASSRPGLSGFPVHEGRSFRDNDDRVAVVGSEVETLAKGSRDHYVFDGRVYPVIGRLGRAEVSHLSKDVVILDRNLFAKKTPETLRVDGPDARRLAKRSELQPVDVAAVGLSRRTGVDFVSSLMLKVGVALLMLGSLFGGYASSARAAARDRVRFVVGASKTSLYAMGLARLLVAWIASVANIDWPSRRNLTSEEQQQELIAELVGA
jgi:hypothetical protein